jgi:hypothetical protein
VGKARPLRRCTTKGAALRKRAARTCVRAEWRSVVDVHSQPEYVVGNALRGGCRQARQFGRRTDQCPGEASVPATDRFASVGLDVAEGRLRLVLDAVVERPDDVFLETPTQVASQG